MLLKSDDQHKSKILFIKGVFIDDILEIDKLIDNRMNNLSNDLFDHKSKIIDSIENSKEVIYDKLPNVFYSFEKWPKSTNLHCWNCDCKFKNVPVFVPKSIEPPDEDKYFIRTTGCFCCFNCAASYINIYVRDMNSVREKQMMLNYLYEIFHDKKIIHISSSPSKFMMKKYGGTLTINEYKTKICKIKNMF